jgi:hypothetical protein
MGEDGPIWNGRSLKADGLLWLNGEAPFLGRPPAWPNQTTKAGGAGWEAQSRRARDAPGGR